MFKEMYSLYNGILRRDREEYVLHPKRMVAKALEIGWLEPEIHPLIILHDVLEVGIEGLTVEELIKRFSLSIKDKIVLDILTAKHNETSEEHFQRVLTSNNLLALKIKFLDCVDNSVMNPEDISWYFDVLNKSAWKESHKYVDRSEKLLLKINQLSDIQFDVF